MFRYAYEYLTESEFEELIVAVCQNVLGIAAHAFATGRDGGRDSSFSGTASNYPNAEHPWSGNFVIQAKHVNNPTESCSDNQKAVPTTHSLQINQVCLNLKLRK